MNPGLMELDHAEIQAYSARRARFSAQIHRFGVRNGTPNLADAVIGFSKNAYLPHRTPPYGLSQISGTVL